MAFNLFTDMFIYFIVVAIFKSIWKVILSLMFEYTLYTHTHMLYIIYLFVQWIHTVDILCYTVRYTTYNFDKWECVCIHI